MSTKSDTAFAALAEMIAEHGIEGVMRMTAEYIEKEVELSECEFGHAWPTEMLDIAREQRALRKRVSKAVLLLTKAPESAWGMSMPTVQAGSPEAYKSEAMVEVCKRGGLTEVVLTPCAGLVCVGCGSPATERPTSHPLEVYCASCAKKREERIAREERAQAKENRAAERRAARKAGSR